LQKEIQAPRGAAAEQKAAGEQERSRVAGEILNHANTAHRS
jgi:hypothetical protein